MIKSLVSPRLAVSLLLLTLVSCKAECQAGNLEPEEKKPAATNEPAKQTEAAKQPAAAKQPEEQLLVCTQVVDGACQNPGVAFQGDLPEIHAVLVTRQIPKTPKATVAWIAEDTGGAAPPNYRIAAKEIDLSGVNRSEATHATISGSLTRPNNGWPKGKYKVVVEMDGKVAAAKQFSVGL